MSVRTTIHLDEDLYTHLKRRASSRKMSQFINQAIAEKLNHLEQTDLESAMRAGYLAVRKDRAQLNKDWEAVDGEGWPE
ncbi:MAG: hypothetical protein IT369_07480 [Candidatus Latescibacteria bacterium]|nr:hypothetical protein [Candidatus Latescibacterota bacterium]